MSQIYWEFRAQADWTFILPSELPTKAAPLAEKNAAAGLSDVTVYGITMKVNRRVVRGTCCLDLQGRRLSQATHQQEADHPCLPLSSCLSEENTAPIFTVEE
jgi:hypothetical protein